MWDYHMLIELVGGGVEKVAGVYIDYGNDIEE